MTAAWAERIGAGARSCGCLRIVCARREFSDTNLRSHLTLALNALRSSVTLRDPPEMGRRGLRTRAGLAWSTKAASPVPQPWRKGRAQESRSTTNRSNRELAADALAMLAVAASSVTDPPPSRWINQVRTKGSVREQRVQKHSKQPKTRSEESLLANLSERLFRDWVTGVDSSHRASAENVRNCGNAAEWPVV